jgi:DHA1 family multidrug resistance protein-like MFS transporter
LSTHGAGKSLGALQGIPKEQLIGISGLVAAAHSTHMIVVPVLPAFVEGMGAALWVVGMALTVSYLARFFTNIPAGVMADKFGRRRIIALGGIGVAIAATLTGTADNVPMFLLFRFLTGMFTAVTITVGNVVFTDMSTVENRGRVLGLVHGMQLVVGIGAPAFGGYLAEFTNVRMPFYASGVVVGVFALWALARMPETRPASVAEHVRRGGGIRTDAPALLRQRGFVLVGLLGAATFFTRSGGSHALVPLYADALFAAGPGVLGVFFTISSLIHGVMVYPTGAIADRYGRKILIGPAGLLVGLALFAFPLAIDLWQVGAMFIFLHIAVAIGGQAPVAYLGDVAPHNMRGAAFGLYRTFGDLAATISPVLLTFVAQAVSFPAAFATNAVVWLVPLVIFWLFAKETAGRKVMREQARAEAAARLAAQEAEAQDGAAARPAPAEDD